MWHSDGILWHVPLWYHNMWHHDVILWYESHWLVLELLCSRTLRYEFDSFRDRARTSITSYLKQIIPIWKKWNRINPFQPVEKSPKYRKCGEKYMFLIQTTTHILLIKKNTVSEIEIWLLFSTVVLPWRQASATNGCERQRRREERMQALETRKLKLDFNNKFKLKLHLIY